MISILKRLKQEDWCKFETNLDYKRVRPCQEEKEEEEGEQKGEGGRRRRKERKEEGKERKKESELAWDRALPNNLAAKLR